MCSLHHFLLAASKKAAVSGSAAIVGITVDYSAAPPAIRRLTTSNDPNRLVTVNIMTEPVPAVGTGAGSSPFDSIYPWSMMEEWNVVDGNVTVKREHPDFSRTAHDTVVFLPPFWYCVMDDPVNKLRYYYVSSEPAPDFFPHPGSGRCVGKYNSNSSYESRSGFLPVASITRAAARSGHNDRGARFSNHDFVSCCAIQLLYFIEYADWDSQAVIGMGFVNNYPRNAGSGSCDAMTYHTGRPDGADGETGVMYRWIENLWGNVSDWIDGINVSGKIPFICTDPANFTEDITDNYISAGLTLPGSGWIAGYGYTDAFPWAFLPSSTAADRKTFDKAVFGVAHPALKIGGFRLSRDEAGLFTFDMNTSIDVTGSTSGTRMLYLPSESEIERMQSASDKTDTGVGDATIEPVRPPAENV